MRQLGAIVLFAALAANLAYAQETSQPAQSQHTDGRPIPAKVYTVGLGVTAPELLPLAPFDIAKGTCTEKKKVKAVLSLIVDSEGLPQNIYQTAIPLFNLFFRSGACPALADSQ